MVSFMNCTEEMEKKAKKINDERKAIRHQQYDDEGKLLSPEDFVMVRVTDGLPRMGYVEASYRYIDPVTMVSPMSSMNDSTFNLDDSFNLKYLRARKTLHWALNSMVATHIGGNFDNRDFVIVEPFIFHMNDDNLVRFAENDTYFKGDVKLSDQAIILVSKEKYEELKANEEFIEILDTYDVRIYDGDQRIALQAVLAEKGYIFEHVGAWGFDFSEELLIMSRKQISKDLGKNTPDHAYTDEYAEEKKEENENMLKSTQLLYETISRWSGILNGQNVELIEKLRKISVPLNYGKVYYYVEESPKKSEAEDFENFFELRGRPDRKLERKMVENFDPLNPEFYEISANDYYDYCVLHCKDEYFCVPNSEVIKLVGLELIKKATDIVNEIVIEESLKYREEKDKVLIGRGFQKK